MPTIFGHPQDHRALEHWLDSPQGRLVLQAEAQLLQETLDGVFGWQLLQLGGWGASRQLLACSRTQRQTVIAEHDQAAGVGLVARLSALPIQSASVDAVLLPHTLEFQPDPRAVVREADRVLAGEGQLIILGFRPLSAWGVRAALTRGGHPPGLRRLLSGRRLRDWLALLGYDVLPTRRCLSSVLSPFGGVSMIRARKRLYTPTPLRPRLSWSLQGKRALIGDAVSPTIRDQL